MKRDMDLVRKILLASEENPSFTSREPLSIGDYSVQVLLYHVNLLNEAGYLDSNGFITEEGSIHLGGLTWKGHEFLDAARDESLWRNTLKLVGNKVGSVPLTVLQSLLEQSLKSMLGVDD